MLHRYNQKGHDQVAGEVSHLAHPHGDGGECLIFQAQELAFEWRMVQQVVTVTLKNSLRDFGMKQLVLLLPSIGIRSPGV